MFNTFREGVWEGEEKIKKMPFKRGEHFEMVIVVNSEGYQVCVCILTANFSYIFILIHQKRFSS